MKMIAVTLTTALLASGCAYVETSKPKTLAETPKGVRVFQPRAYLAVDAAKGASTLFSVQDPSTAYDVRPMSILAKHDFQIDLDEGQVKTLKSNQDPTAFLTFIKDAATLAANSGKAAGAPTNFTSSFGLATGLYRMNDLGKWERAEVP